MGQLPHTWPNGPPFSGRWNKRLEDEPPCKHPVDLGWIGEDSKGVWVKRDPQVALLDYPALWPVMTQWEAGQRELTAHDFETLSAYHYGAKFQLAVAQAREDQRGRKEKSR